MTRIKSPPKPKNEKGETRKVGVEIEFAGIDAKKGAEIVQKLFGGSSEKITPHRYKVKDTEFGEFVVELDTQYAFPGKFKFNDKKEKSRKLENEIQETLQALDKVVSEWVGDVSSVVVPYEIVCPPIPWKRLDVLTPLFEELRKEGAKGTTKNPFYAFGLHLNPEVAEETADYALNHLRAYIVLADWLRKEIRIDLTRQITPHTKPFPKAYALKIMDKNYTPDLKELIADYLKNNKTRNRGLDMLPLFAHLDGKTVGEKVHDKRIKARPTFHYRLPNANLSEKDWNPVKDWNLWVKVEELALDKETLEKAREAFIDHHKGFFAGDWAAEAGKFVSS